MNSKYRSFIKWQTVLAIILITLFLPLATPQTSVSVSLLSRSINVNTTYTFTVSFDNAVNRTYLTLIFPTGLNLDSSKTSVSINSSTLNSSLYKVNYPTTNKLYINKTFNTSVIVTVAFVQNPSYAQQIYGFFIQTNNVYDYGNVSLLQYSNLITYTAGSLQSCNYNFVGTTEQSSAKLNTEMVLGNPIPAGINMISIGYPIKWDNLNSKTLITSGSVITCTYSLNNSVSTSPSPCTYDTSQIYVNITSATTIVAGSKLTVQVTGVNCPPTVKTSTSDSFKIITSSTSGYQIDMLSNCQISDTTVSTAVGSFSNIALAINSRYSSPIINFNTPVPSTFLNIDNLEVTTDATIGSCISGLILSRGSPTSWLYTNTVGNVRYYSGNFGNNNANSTLAFTIYFDCSFTTPTSANPSIWIFTFKHNGSPYLNLTSTFTANTVVLSSNRFALTLDTYSAVVNAIYTLSLNISNALGNQAQIITYLPLAVNMAGFTNNSCNASRNGQLMSISQCSYQSTSTNYAVLFAFNEANIIAAGTNIILLIKGLKNPSQAYYKFIFGIQTYYSSNLPLSKVQYNLQIASQQYTTHSTTNLVLSPSSYYVYNQVNASITYTNQVDVLSGSYITLYFPKEMSNLTFSSLVYLNNSTLQTVNESSITNTSTYKQLTFRYNSDLVVGSKLTIPFTMITPSNLGTYGPINMTVIYGTDIYEQSYGFLMLPVTLASPIDFTITLTGNTTNQSTGAQCIYSFKMITYIPHPSIFYLQIQFPTDTSFISNGTCSGSCRSTIGMINNSTVNLTIVNNNSASTFSFMLGYFVNPRTVGLSMAWSFATFNQQMLQIGSGNSYVNIPLANTITGLLSKNDRYYRGNNNTVSFYLTLFNKLLSTDYILIQFGTDTYTANPLSSISCYLTIGNCSIVSSSSTSSLLVVKVAPSINQISTNQITIILLGLLSSTYTIYNDVKYFNVSTFNSADRLIDQGYVAYNITCGENATLSCKECTITGVCISCYVNEGMYMLNGKCVANCTKQSMYQNFNANGTCQSCINFCGTCYNDTACRTCQNNTGSTMYLFSDMTCQSNCPTSNGYFEITLGGVLNCFSCYDTTNCIVCVNSSYNGCTKCTSGPVLQQGQCLLACTISNTYISGDGSCQPCNLYCDGCNGGTVADCLKCTYPYLNYTGICVSSCPVNTVAIASTQTCGCEGNCTQCVNSTIYCTACKNSSSKVYIAYKGSCLTGTCPIGSYLFSNTQCLSCTAGCANCSSDIVCYQCQTNKYSYNNKCYSDCNLITLQYDNDITNMVCVLCPNGCDQCASVQCLSCLSGFQLVNNSSCLSDCVVMGNCKPDVPDKILPLPGLLSTVGWCILIIVVKLILKKLYIPYSLMYGLCLIELIIIIASISQLNVSPTTTARLLLGTDYSYRLIIKDLLIVGLAFNYITNLIYLFIFFKYISPMIMNPRQIDYIVNGIILFIATITNYRFGLIAFSRMFPKPEIQVENSSKLTPINYLTVMTLILDVIPLAAGGLLVYKEYVGTNLFMLGIDLVLILILLVCVTIVMVAVPKPDQYYISEVKKFNIQENYRTEQNLEEKNLSFGKLMTSNFSAQKVVSVTVGDDMISHPMQQHTIEINPIINHTQQALQSEQQNPPLPTISKSQQQNKADKTNKIILTDSIGHNQQPSQQDIDQIINLQKHPSILPNNSTLVRNKNPTFQLADPLQNRKTKRVNQKSIEIKVQQNQKSEELNNQQLLQRKQKQSAINFSKQKIKKHYTNNKKRSQTQFIYQKPNVKLFTTNKEQEDDSQMQTEFLTNKVQLRQNTNQMLTNSRSKHKPKRKESSDIKIVKKNTTRVYETEHADESKEDDQIDIDAIIDSKIKQSQSFDRGLMIRTQKQNINEDISPSWFNSQNQRIDVSEIEEIE